VRSGEDLWTSDELGQVRADLASEAAGLHAGVVQAAADIAGGRTGSARDAGDDEADAGTKTAEREHELAAAQNAQDLLDQGERALARLDAGTYGVCESCGQPVGKARLLAFPRASLCLVCKQRQERR
jgi:RNA polymerase-binding protein DksA